jgi:HEAT repeat protein
VTDRNASRERALAALRKLTDPAVPWQERASLRRQVLAAADDLEGELIRGLRVATDVGVLNELLDVVGGSGNPTFEDALERLVHDPDAPVEVRQTAATSLGKLGTSGGLAILADLLDDPSPHVVLGAVHGLAASGHASAVRSLARVLDRTTPVKVWWAGPKAGGYVIGREAAHAIDRLTGCALGGDPALVSDWIREHLGGAGEVGPGSSPSRRP